MEIKRTEWKKGWVPVWQNTNNGEDLSPGIEFLRWLRKLRYNLKSSPSVSDTFQGKYNNTMFIGTEGPVLI